MHRANYRFCINAATAENVHQDHTRMWDFSSFAERRKNQKQKEIGQLQNTKIVCIDCMGGWHAVWTYLCDNEEVNNLVIWRRIVAIIGNVPTFSRSHFHSISAVQPDFLWSTNEERQNCQFHLFRHRASGTWLLLNSIYHTQCVVAFPFQRIKKRIQFINQHQTNGETTIKISFFISKTKKTVDAWWTTNQFLEKSHSAAPNRVKKTL